jgi:adenine modification enzyme
MAKKDLIYSDQQSMFGAREIIGFGSTDFYIKEIPKKKSKEMIIKNHYSHKVCNDATTHIHLGCFINGELLGCLQFGYAMNPQSMASVVANTKLNEYKELNRMWFDDKAERNTESKAISYAIKYIRSKFKTVKWIQSFADERCGGLGIVYQAANFRFYGEHTNVMWEFENEIYHNSHITNNNRNSKARLEAKGFHEKATKIELRQFRYIYFLNQKSIKDCLLKEKPYPKHYVEKPNNFEKVEAGGR